MGRWYLSITSFHQHSMLSFIALFVEIGMRDMTKAEEKTVFSLMGNDITESQIKHLVTLLREKPNLNEEMCIDGQAEEYIGRPDYHQTVQSFYDHESPVMSYCAYQVMKEHFIIEDECWFKDSPYSTSAKRIPALYDTLPLKKTPQHKDDRVRIPKKGHYFCKHKKDKTKWVFSFQTWEGAELDIRISTAESHDRIKGVFDSIDSFFALKGPLKGACFNPHWKWVEPEYANWNCVILGEEVKDALDLNIVTFLDNLDLYEEHNLPTSRGILLSGLPGTGKTLTMEVLLNEFSKFTRIYAPAETLSQPNAINDTYALARKLSPTLVIIEDIDTLGQSQDHQDRSIYVSQLLSSLNSAEPNSGVITVASTNYPQALDIALRDRPGRFDARINFTLPNTEERMKILKKYSSPFKISDVKWKTWAKKTENFTGAWLRELVTTAFTLAVREAKSNKKPVLKEKYMEQAFSIVEKTRSLVNQRRSQEEENENLFM